MPQKLPVGYAEVRGRCARPGLESQRLSSFGDEGVVGYEFVDTIKALPGAGVQVVVDACLRRAACVAASSALVNVDTRAGSTCA